MADYSTSDWPARVREAAGDAGVDVAYDIVGGPASLAAPAPGGELSLQWADTRSALRNRGDDHPKPVIACFALLPLLSTDGPQGQPVRAFPSRRRRSACRDQRDHYPLDEANEAQRSLEERRSTGRVVLIP
ncbi:zinc-binding dehydrogenase [Mesorhizobium sp.]|uniref:zinc-binding dehydrogenase n=1 Tax=Mesorhizobium sp. TaxID=1871066 RepID=UPI000FE68E0E|nr:zinc-binding dehydrogenase [Mesorhizobium sp.]RWN53205.1 MAG: hypothetical protein EOS00_31280 [Mesorhizobium sp.]